MSYSNVLNSVYPSVKGQNPQSEPLPGQIENNAGGHYYEVSDWEKLDRLLILGTELPTFYISAKELTVANCEAIKRLIAIDYKRVINRIVEVSEQGLAPKNDHAILALAIVASYAPEESKAALEVLPRVARTASHFLMFVSFVDKMRGWGRGLRKGINNWFLSFYPDNLAYQFIKYSNRNGWSLRDVLRKSHIKIRTPYIPSTADSNFNPITSIEKAKTGVLFDYVVHPKKEEAIKSAEEYFPLIKGKHKAFEVKTDEELVNIIKEYKLTREMIPNQFLNSKLVWIALLEKMPLTALIRNLGKMTKIELIAPLSDTTNEIVKKLENEEYIKSSRVHPLQLLIALKTYSKGHGEKGSLTWIPVSQITAALENAFYLSFKSVIPTNKKILLALDISGSMDAECHGASSLKCIEAGAGICLMLNAVEKQVHTIFFDDKVHIPQLTGREKLNQFIFNGGGTDISLPFRYALDKKIECDIFVIISDNETWAGKEHPVQALYQYRKQVNSNAKVLTLCCSANSGIITDPKDNLSMGIAGFDSSVHQVMYNFINK